MLIFHMRSTVRRASGVMWNWLFQEHLKCLVLIMVMQSIACDIGSHDGTSRSGLLNAASHMLRLYRSAEGNHGDSHQLRFLQQATTVRSHRCQWLHYPSDAKRVPLTFSCPYVSQTIPDKQNRLVHMELRYRLKSGRISGPTIMRLSVISAKQKNASVMSMVNVRYWFDWHVVPLTKLMKGKLAPNVSTLRLLLRLESRHVSSVTEVLPEPFLVAYSQEVSQRPLLTALHHGLPRVGLLTKQRVSRGEKRKASCHRIDMIVNVKSIGWDAWIIQPHRFNSYRCNGTCSHIPSEGTGRHTNHATVQSLLSVTGQLVRGQTIPPPCCAPDRLGTVQLLFYEKVNGDLQVVLKNVEDLRVLACSCR